MSANGRRDLIRRLKVNLYARWGWGRGAVQCHAPATLHPGKQTLCKSYINKQPEKLYVVFNGTMFPHTVTHWVNFSLSLEVDSQFLVGTSCTALYSPPPIFIKFLELFVCFNYYSGLESASFGTHYQAVGPQTQYQQCQKYDNFKLLIGTHGYSFLTVWVLLP